MSSTKFFGDSGQNMPSRLPESSRIARLFLSSPRPYPLWISHLLCFKLTSTLIIPSLVIHQVAQIPEMTPLSRDHPRARIDFRTPLIFTLHYPLFSAIFPPAFHSIFLRLCCRASLHPRSYRWTRPPWINPSPHLRSISSSIYGGDVDRTLERTRSSRYDRSPSWIPSPRSVGLRTGPVQVSISRRNSRPSASRILLAPNNNPRLLHTWSVVVLLHTCPVRARLGLWILGCSFFKAPKHILTPRTLIDRVRSQERSLINE
jgi:hypothetical protein